MKKFLSLVTAAAESTLVAFLVASCAGESLMQGHPDTAVEDAAVINPPDVIVTPDTTPTPDVPATPDNPTPPPDVQMTADASTPPDASVEVDASTPPPDTSTVDPARMMGLIGARFNQCHWRGVGSSSNGGVTYDQFTGDITIGGGLRSDIHALYSYGVCTPTTMACQLPVESVTDGCTLIDLSPDMNGFTAICHGITTHVEAVPGSCRP